MAKHPEDTRFTTSHEFVLFVTKGCAEPARGEPHPWWIAAQTILRCNLCSARFHGRYACGPRYQAAADEMSPADAMAAATFVATQAGMLHLEKAHRESFEGLRPFDPQEMGVVKTERECVLHRGESPHAFGLESVLCNHRNNPHNVEIPDWPQWREALKP